MIKTFEDRKKECSEEIKKVLELHGFNLDCKMILGVGSITPIIDLIEIKKESPIITK